MRRGKTRRGKAWRGEAGRGGVKRSEARPGEARLGKAERVKAGRVEARRDEAAVQVGTLFLTTDEAGTKPTHRAALLRRDGRRTVVTRVFTGRPARALENRFTAEMAQHAVTGYPEVHVLTGGIRSEAAAQDDPEHLHLWAGTGYAACAEESAASVLARFSPLRRDGDVAFRGDRPTS